MPKSNPELIKALRETADRLSDGAKYEWGHMGRCNCGHLVQTITHMSDYDIAASLDFELDEWTEYAKDYCPGTGHKVEDLFMVLQQHGFSQGDVVHLENLSDKRVLKRIGGPQKHLRKNSVEDVQLYMQTMATLLEEELV